jgi:hypothetical protein
MRDRQQRLGRHTTRIEAITTHLTTLNQRHPKAERSRNRSDRKAGSTGADDGDVCVWH